MMRKRRLLEGFLPLILISIPTAFLETIFSTKPSIMDSTLIEHIVSSFERVDEHFERNEIQDTTHLCRLLLDYPGLRPILKACRTE
jgi:hypothetical protein